jgi:hypothetical protein
MTRACDIASGVDVDVVTGNRGDGRAETTIITKATRAA